MPRPFLTPLTGGYRRIPVLQIGADIYCDTARILRELDRRWANAPPAVSLVVARDEERVLLGSYLQPSDAKQASA